MANVNSYLSQSTYATYTLFVYFTWVSSRYCVQVRDTQDELIFFCLKDILKLLYCAVASS